MYRETDGWTCWLVDHLFQYRILTWPKAAEKRGFCTCVTDIRMDGPTDRPSYRDAFLTDASKKKRKWKWERQRGMKPTSYRPQRSGLLSLLRHHFILLQRRTGILQLMMVMVTVVVTMIKVMVMVGDNDSEKIEVFIHSFNYQSRTHANRSGTIKAICSLVLEMQLFLGSKFAISWDAEKDRF